VSDGVTQSFVARAAALAEVFAFLRRWAESAGLGPDDVVRLCLVAEELFLNSVLHGYGGDCDERVQLWLRSDDLEIELELEDCAGEFDPFAAIESPSESANPQLRPVGRLGLPLVIQLSARRRYQRIGERNRIWLALTRRF
jgi:serine/threonine-protein kinase RsbW